MAAAPPPWRRVAGGLELALRVRPGARTDRVDGIVRLDDGACALAVRVKAPPAGGRANAALIALLARRWKLPKSALRLVAGAGGRRKRVHLMGDPATLAARLAADLDTDGREA